MINIIAIIFILLLGISCVVRVYDDYKKDKKKGGKMP